jgi:hypothetical protein
MNSVVMYATAFVVLAASPLAAQTRAQIAAEPVVKLQPGEAPVPGECLTRQQLDLIAALNALHRPTVGVEGDGDDQAPFNPHYFIGTWAITGALPDSALGPGGDFVGTETVRHVDGCTYESTIQATLPEGKVTIKALVVYDRRERYMVRLEDDSRGFRLLKMGRVGGDPGGYASHFWETPPVTRQRRQVRLKGRTLVTSPDGYRLAMQISVDGDRFTNYGTLLWERAAPRRP